MKLKELHALMQVDLEQYPTGPHLASRLLFAVDSSYDELAGKTVVDLGCGTAMLSIGAALLGSRHVMGLDIDPDALEVAQDNIAQFEEPLPIDLVLADVRELPALLPRLRADTVVMNPPFGTKQKGVDMAFLRTAFSIATTSVYSLHKSSTRDFIARTARRDLGASSAEVLAQLRYDLPATMKFHRQKSVDIEVDLWRFEVGEAAASRRDVDAPLPEAVTPPKASDVTTTHGSRGGGAAGGDDGGGTAARGGTGRRRGGGASGSRRRQARGQGRRSEHEDVEEEEEEGEGEEAEEQAGS